MKERIIDRVFQFIETQKLKRHVVEKTCGISNDTLKKAHASNRKGMDQETIEKLLIAYPELNDVWLLTGRGEMLNSPHGQQNVNGDNIHGQTVTVNKGRSIESGTVVDTDCQVELDKAKLEIKYLKEMLSVKDDLINHLKNKNAHPSHMSVPA